MIIAITNQKGGVGKTTLSINLSCSLALLGYRVLLIDMDPQGNSTDGIGLLPSQIDKTIYDVLINEVPISDATIPHALDNLFVVPANISLFGAEAELSTEISRPFKLRQAVKPEMRKYDYIIIDCPPNLGVLTVNAILASTDLIVPIEPNSYALKGMSVLMTTLLKIKDDIEHNPNFLGVVINMFQPENDLHASMLEHISDYFPSQKVFDTRIHRNSLIAEAEIYGKSIVQYNTFNEAARQFIQLAKELVLKQNERLEKRQTETAR